jgi:hypothetical protein
MLMPKLLDEDFIIGQGSFYQDDTNSIFTLPGLVQNRALETVDVVDYAYSLNYYINKNKKQNIHLSDMWESYEPRFMNFVSSVASQLMSNYHIPYENIFFTSGGLPIPENFHLYNVHCKNHKWIRVNLALTNSFEMRMKKYLDFRYNTTGSTITTPLSYNRPKVFTFLNGGARVHRLYLFLYLVSENLLDKAYFSMHTPQTIINYLKYNMRLEHLRLPLIYDLFDIYEKSGVSLPIKCTLEIGDFEGQHMLTEDDINLFQNSYFSLIGETSFFKKMHMNEENLYNPHLDSIFCTEKTYRAIACKHPFILMARPYTLKHLKKFGYKSFDPYIDESYDDILDDNERLIKIANIVKTLCLKDKAFWKEFVDYTKDIVEHNFNILMNSKPIIYTQDDFANVKKLDTGI